MAYPNVARAIPADSAPGFARTEKLIAPVLAVCCVWRLWVEPLIRHSQSRNSIDKAGSCSASAANVCSSAIHAVELALHTLLRGLLIQLCASYLGVVLAGRNLFICLLCIC